MSDNMIGRRELFKRTAAGVTAGALGATVGVKTAQAQEPTVPLLDKVPTKKLGTTGADIPIMLMGGSQKFDPVFDKMLHRAYKMGMYYIDTAEAYANGQSHVTLKPFIEQVGRKNLWLTSKSGMFPGGGVATVDMYRDAIMKEFDVLGTDYIDMYFFHGVKHLEVLDPEYIAFFDEMKKSGKAKYTGFSCHDGNVVELMNKAASIGGDAINAIMFRYNFSMYGDTELNKAMDACKAAGIGLLGMKTQSSVPEDSEMVKTFESQNFSLHQARLKAAWADDRIDGCVSGINNMEILRDNTTAARSMVDLTAREMNQLQQYAARTAHHNCKGCSHLCENAVKGDLAIADQLRFLMYDESYGEHALARQRFHELTPSQRDFRGTDLTAAMAACPQGIDIESRLAEAHRRLA